DALRERRDLSRLHVVRDAFPKLERAVLAPELAGLPRHPSIGVDLALRNRDHESVDVLGHGEISFVRGLSRTRDRSERENSSGAQMKTDASGTPPARDGADRDAEPRPAVACTTQPPAVRGREAEHQGSGSAGGDLRSRA